MSTDDAPADLGRISTVRVSPGSTPPAVAAEDWSGRVLAGRYELLREVGRGGMGIVYEARHVTLRRAVAVKVLRPEFAHSEDALSRFEREARAAAAIGSPHIVEVVDFGREATGEAWMVMELLDGEDLRARIRRRGPMGDGPVRAVLRDVAVALRDAHAKGIVHRDLKSENVLLVQREGREIAKVVDFGISKVLADPSRSAVTARDVLLGTPHYMAPETADPDASPDHRVDLYALGCIAYESLTGRLPFAGRTAVEVLYQHTHAPVPAPSAKVDVDPRLDRIVRRLLAKRPEHRYPSAEALIADLDAPPRRPRGRVALAALLALCALGAALGLARRSRAAPTSPSLALRVPVRATIAPLRDAGAASVQRPREVVEPRPASAPPVAARDVAPPAAPRRRRVVSASTARPDAGAPPRTVVDGLRPSPY